MSLKSGTEPSFMQNLKSILADRNQSPDNTFFRMAELNRVVTFANNGKGSKEGSATNLSNTTPPGTAKDGTKGRPNVKNNYNFGIFSGPRAPSPTAKGDEPSLNSESDASKSRLNQKSPKNVSILYPSEVSRKTKVRISPGPSTGVLLLGKSEDTIVHPTRGLITITSANTKPKSGSSPRLKKLVGSARSSISNTPKRSKSGKKLKKKRKSKVSQFDREPEPIKPAQLNEEYASELNKITQILKAVSAFDEATGTGNGAVTYGSSSKNNLIANFTYSGAESSNKASPIVSGGGLGLATPSGNVRRPLSADELKQLLSSITRVVSLHQLPVNRLPSASALKNSPAFAVAQTNITGTRQPTPPTMGSVVEEKETVLEKALNIPDIPSSIIKTKKKKSRKLVKSPMSDKGASQTELGGNKAGGSGSNSSVTKVKRKSRPKYKSKKTRRGHSDGSFSDSEKDPVKNAQFLRRYFEESVRLANRKSSDELLDKENNKSKKKLKKNRTSSSKKPSTKSIPGKSHNT